MYDVNWRSIAEINGIKSPYVIYPGQKICISTTGSVTPPTPTPTPMPKCTAKVYASSVKEDQNVTIQGVNLVPNTRYSMYFSKYGNYPNKTVTMSPVRTDGSGKFSVFYNIPRSLVDVAKIGINIKSDLNDTATNWFYNATADGANTGGVCTAPFSFSIVSVNNGISVTIKTTNLPANIKFDVLMGKAGTQAVNGTLVGTLIDGDGVIKATYNIPASLAAEKKLDIRVASAAANVSYYLTFDN